MAAERKAPAPPPAILDKFDDDLNITVTVPKTELKVEHLMDSREDENGKLEYKAKVTTCVWLTETDLEGHPLLLKRYWKAHKRLQALKLSRDKRKRKLTASNEFAVDTNKTAEQSQEDATGNDEDTENVLSAKNEDETDSKQLQLQQQQLKQQLQADSKPIQSSSSVSIVKNVATVECGPKRSKRLKENDERLSLLYHCKQCSKSFRNDEIFTAHMLDHEKPPKLRLSKDMFVITQSVDKKKEYQCRLCSQLFNEKRDAISHQHIHGGSNPWYCDKCDKHFLRKFKYTRHLLMHSGTKNFVCEDCGKKFNGPDYLQRHRDTYCPAADKTKLQCDICKETFKEKRLLEAHIGIHNGTNPYFCQICQKHFLKKSVYEVHMNEHEQLKPYRCQACLKRFVSKGEYNRHVKLHDDELFICACCKEVYTLQEDLEMHYQMSETCVELLCTECNIEFPCVSDLRNHLQSFAANTNPETSNEAVYICKFCQRGFHVYSTFLQHRPTHVCEKRQTCSHCDMNFPTKEKLAAHAKQIHDVSTFPCYICGKVFNDNMLLKRHTKAAHAQDTTFRCVTCDVMFHSRTDFNKHQQSESHIKKTQEHGHFDKVSDASSSKLTCSICERIFPNANELQRHEFLHQRVQVKSNNAVIKESVADAPASPQFYNTGLYDIQAGEQIILTDNEGRIVTAKLNVDAAGNMGLVYLPPSEVTHILPTSTENVLPQTQYSHISIEENKEATASSTQNSDGVDASVSETVEAEETVQSTDETAATTGEVPVNVSQPAASTPNIQPCNEETFLALSEMVQQGKLDLSSLQIIQNNDS